jgi:hypothetical protein
LNQKQHHFLEQNGREIELCKFVIFYRILGGKALQMLPVTTEEFAQVEFDSAFTLLLLVNELTCNVKSTNAVE